MKKILCTLIVAALLTAPVSSLAAAYSTDSSASYSVSDPDAMQAALIAVKSKINIPDAFTEFSGDSSSYDGATTYRFTWSDTDNNNSLYISCDDKGRIDTYIINDNYSPEPEQKLPLVSLDQARTAAEQFLKQTVPEATEDANDCLVYSGSSDRYSSNQAYSLSFKRMRNGVEVSSDSAYICVSAEGDTPVITYFSMNFTYDAVFESEADEIQSPEASYKSLFPAEQVYSRIYQPNMWRYDRNYKGEIRLLYRIKDADPGYISAYTGEAVEETYGARAMATADSGSAESYSASTSSMKDELSPQEQSELDNIAGLHSAEECEAFLRSIPQLSFTDTLTLSNAQLYRADKTEKEYSLSLSFNSQDDQRSLYADFDAVRGRITSLNNYSYYSDYDNDQPLTEAQIKDGNAQIDSFLDLVIKDKLPEFELISDKPSEKLYSVSRRYRRIVNGIPYISNTLNVNYSPSKERIVYYNLNYEDNAQFADPSTAIDADTAYTYLLAQSPLKKKYIRSGDLYRLVYGISGSPQIDAFTGGSLYENSSYTPTETVYNDISGHWCETAVNALRDYGIALNGESFEPDTAITQSDLLRLFALGIKARDLDISSNDDLYNLCYSYGILTNDERSDDTPLTREQAFIYMIRFAGYENIAKLPDIYKVEYADGNMLTSGNIGYAAILSGMGVLCGDGGYLRPQDNITRAETAAMLYKYMTN